MNPDFRIHICGQGQAAATTTTAIITANKTMYINIAI